MADNLITQVLEAASRHAGNPAVTALVSKLDVARRSDRSRRGEPRDPFAGWRRGTDGAEGHGLMFAFYADGAPFAPMIRDMAGLIEVATIAECLASVLAALGEEISY